MTVAAPVIHPARPQIELLEAGVPLDQRMLNRLQQLGVTSLWVHHDATADLQRVIDPNLGRTRRQALEQLQADFSQMSQATVHAGSVATYRQLVMELIVELLSNKNLANLTDQLVGGPPGFFRHAANVAYLSLVIGLHLETYVAKQRARLASEHARDLTNLGLGAMFHDIGKLKLNPDQRDLHEPHLADPTPPSDEPADDITADTDNTPRYHEHPRLGYEIMQQVRAPASASQIVLNHHQRYDGTGFPDMSAHTQQRREGAQHGQQIHIFNRIAAVANALDNLLTDPAGNARPPVAALKDLASNRFDGWFDPVVRDAALRCLPPFAIGTPVTLNDGRAAAVVAPCLEQPCRPSVRLLSESDRTDNGRYPTLQLIHHPELHITESASQPVTAHLFSLPEPKSLERQAG